MSQEMNFYASDEQVTKLMSKEFGLRDINYIFDNYEVSEKHSGLASECSLIIASLIKSLSIRANIKFVIIDWPNPFSVTKIDHAHFIVLVGIRACNLLWNLCHRLVTLHPLADITNNPKIEEPRNFEKRFLLDISKEMTFQPIDLDNVNSDLGKEVARAALFSILSHEVAHIVKGHFEFKKSIEFLELKKMKF